MWIKSRGTMKENTAKTNCKSYRSKLEKLIQQAELNYLKTNSVTLVGILEKLGLLLIPYDVKVKIISSLILLIQMMLLYLTVVKFVLSLTNIS